ncbi:MAG: hypothetical protein Q9160_002187 [Pyrenula sp. 1 TL-2023]
MSENIPESIPTSQDPRSHRPLKRRALTPTSATASEISVLMSDPSRPLDLPPSSTANGKTLAPPPEIVANVQGSSAGAGSGEFHVYKAGRRREYERLRLMDEEVRKEKEKGEWEEEQEERRRGDEERMKKNREKREKKKKAKKGKGGGGGGAAANSSGKVDGQQQQQRNGKMEGLERVNGGDRGRGRDGVGAKGKTEEGVEALKIAVEEVGVTIHDDD